MVPAAVSDWFHPLAVCKFKKMDQRDQPNVDHQSVPVLWNGDVYMPGHGYHMYTTDRKDSIWKYSISSNSWDELPIPCNDSRSYALTTYRSKLLLVGGYTQTSETTRDWPGTVWEFDDKKLLFKKSSIEAVPKFDHDCVHNVVSAASQGDYLIIVHKIRSENDEYSLKIFDGKSWTIRKGPQASSSGIAHVTVFNEHIFVSEYADYSQPRISNIYETSLQSLLSNTSSSSNVWQKLKGTSPVPLWDHSNLLIHNSHLVIMASCDFGTQILAYSICHKSWIDLGHINESCMNSPPRIVELSDGELLMMGKGMGPREHAASLYGSRQFDVCRINPEGAYIQIVCLSYQKLCHILL